MIEVIGNLEPIPGFKLPSFSGKGTLFMSVDALPQVDPDLCMACFCCQ